MDRVTVFGGSGFVGRYIVKRLASEGAVVRVAVRRPEEALFLKAMGLVGQIAPVHGDVRSDASVRAAVQAKLDEVNAGLASFETIKYFRLLPEPMTVENGILTASLKVKRKVVHERYAELIDEMYASAKR